MSTLRYGTVRRLRTPAYPLRMDVQRDPRLLLRRTPKRWRGRRELTAVLGAALAAQVSGCSKAQQPAAPTQVSGTRTLVAPLFEHGDGQGDGQEPQRFAMLGCVALAHPYYLAETEALQVIIEELRRHGVELTERDVAWSDVIVKGNVVERAYEWSSDSQSACLKPVEGPLVVDLVDPKLNVGVEYVGWDEFLPLGGRDDNESGWGVADLKTVVTSVGREVSQRPADTVFASFYDPVVSEGWNGEARLRDDDEDPFAGQGDDETERTADEVSKELLRRQVRDFVEWLKGQGVI